MNENKFFTTNLRQITVTLAIYVPVGSQKRVHIDRADHGFFLNVNAESVVRFDTGKTITVKNGQIGYLPRSSNYTVKNMSGSGGCYAIKLSLFSARRRRAVCGDGEKPRRVRFRVPQSRLRRSCPVCEGYNEVMSCDARRRGSADKKRKRIRPER